MGLYTDKISYFKNLASIDPNIACSENNNSFFDVADEDALAAAIANNVHYPFVWVEDLRGNLKSLDGGINQNYTWSLRFYTKAEFTETDFENEAIRKAYDDTLEILKHWQHRIINDAFNDDGSALFQNVDNGSFSFSKTEKFKDNFFGWQLQFNEVHVLNFILPEKGYWNK